MKLFTEREVTSHTVLEREVVNDIKEKLCYIATDFNSEMVLASSVKSEYEETYQVR